MKIQLNKEENKIKNLRAKHEKELEKFKEDKIKEVEELQRKLAEGIQ